MLLLLQSDLLEPIHGALLSFGSCLWKSVGTGIGKQMSVCLCVQSVCIREMFRAFRGISLQRKLSAAKVEGKQHPGLRENEDPGER